MKLTKHLNLTKKEVKNIESKVEKISENQKSKNEFEKYSNASKNTIFLHKEKIYLRLKTIDSLEMNRSSEFLLFFLETKILLKYNLNKKLKKELKDMRDKYRKEYIKLKPIFSRVFGYSAGIIFGFNLFKKNHNLSKV
ncbi:MAG: hypothetical protein ACOCRX_00040 [Candidatus Woesearchaeota archaeon]